MKIYIKNMVCKRCVLAVERVVHGLGLQYESIEMGEIELADDQDKDFLQKALLSLDEALGELGFSVLGDKRAQLIESIKKASIHYLENLLEPGRIKLSEYIERAVPRDYTYLSNLFSSVEGVTIEQYFITLRVERAKELLVYDELSLKEVAYQLGYSSAAHFSGQFKKATGLTPSYFRQLKNNKLRLPIDKL